MWAWHFSACLLFFLLLFYFVVRIRRHRKKFTFAISSPWWVSCCFIFSIKYIIKSCTTTTYTIKWHKTCSDLKKFCRITESLIIGFSDNNKNKSENNTSTRNAVGNFCLKITSNLYYVIWKQITASSRNIHITSILNNCIRTLFNFYSIIPLCKLILVGINPKHDANQLTHFTNTSHVHSLISTCKLL